MADLENHALFKDDLECQKLILEAMKYHLLPERRTLMQSPRTKPRKSTVGTLYAVGGMDNNKGTMFFALWIILHILSENGEITFCSNIGEEVSKSVKKCCHDFWSNENLWIFKEKHNTVREKKLSFEFIISSKLL